MASRLYPNRSLGLLAYPRLARTVKNIWTKSETRRTSQPGSMMKVRCLSRAGQQPARKFSGRGGTGTHLDLVSGFPSLLAFVAVAVSHHICHITSHHITSYHITSYHIISYHDITLVSKVTFFEKFEDIFLTQITVD